MEKEAEGKVRGSGLLQDDISILLRKMRDIFPSEVDASYVGTHGKCYQVALFLKHVYPEAEIHYSPTEGHVYTLIQGRYYDIDGIHVKVPEDTTLLDHRSGHRPHRWHLGCLDEGWYRGKRRENER